MEQAAAAAANRTLPIAKEVTLAVLVANPKKPGTAAHARFSLYEKSATVGEFLAAGGKRVDLAWDFARGYLALVSPLPEAAPAPAEG